MILLQRLYTKNIDVFTTYTHTVWLSGDLQKKDANLMALYCEEYESTWVFVGRKGLPEDMLQRFVSFALKAHKDPDFKQFQFAFTMVKGHFVPLSDKAIELNKKTSELISKQGWRKEDPEFYKKYYRPPKKQG